MNRVYYFELPVEDMDRATKFYENVFGWNITKQDRAGGPYYSVKTGSDDESGINGSFYLKEEGWATTNNVIDVKEIDQAISKIEELGGKIVFAKCIINGVGYLAYFNDPDGNTFGMMQNDSSVEGGM